MANLTVLFSLGILIVWLIIILAIVAVRRRRRSEMVRQPMDLDTLEFARSLYGDEPRKGALAVQLLELLSEEYSLPPGRIRPEDRLFDDLGVDLEADPQFLWQLKEKFGLRVPMDNLEDHQLVVHELTSFGDLVEFVARDETPPG